LKRIDSLLILGIGDWGLGIGDWGLGVGAQAQNPKPQTPNPKKFFFKKKYLIKKY